METDIRPIDDEDLMPPPPQPRHRMDMEEDERESHHQTPIYLPNQPSQQFYAHPMHNRNNSTADFFGEIDKTTYIIIFVAFILGFFMGKTMQPVILRPG